MSSSIFALDLKAKTLNPLQRRSLADLGLTEPYDLEAWLSSRGDGLFARRLLWIARQHRAADEQRSDLVGIDELGNVLISELKRGVLAEDAITQALAYAAEYSRKTADELIELFAAQSTKEGSTGLVAKAVSRDDAQAQLNNLVGRDTKLNESQVILLVGEDFTPNALAICEFLNGSRDASFSIECWRYAVFESAAGHHFLLEQILPPPNVRHEVEEKREAAKAKKYARDPVRVEFMSELMQFLRVGGRISTWRNRGQSYDCQLCDESWVGDYELLFSVKSDVPRLALHGLQFTGDPSKFGLSQGDGGEGCVNLDFVGIDANKARFESAFGERLVEIVQLMKPTEGTIPQSKGEVEAEGG